MLLATDSIPVESSPHDDGAENIMLMETSETNQCDENANGSLVVEINPCDETMVAESREPPIEANISLEYFNPNVEVSEPNLPSEYNHQEISEKDRINHDCTDEGLVSDETINSDSTAMAANDLPVARTPHLRITDDFFDFPPTANTVYESFNVYISADHFLISELRINFTI